MMVVRRWYLFVSATIGLQGFTWSFIWLLYGVFVTSGQLIETTALQLAALIVCLPLWLGHWWWAERLADRYPDERASGIRQLYLYGHLTAFLLPLIGSVTDLLSVLLRLLVNRPPADPMAQFWYGTIASCTLGVLFAYHGLVARNDAARGHLVNSGAFIRRLYLFVAAGVGLLVYAGGAVGLIQVLGASSVSSLSRLVDASVGTIVGLGVWVGHWMLLQQLFVGADEIEQQSVLRKVYLYLVIVIASMVAVTNATIILASLFRQALGLPVFGQLIDGLAPVIVATLIALYHGHILQTDATLVSEAPRQAGIRRVAWYLVAAVGQLAMVAGLGGLLSVLIRSLAGAGVVSDLREPLAWFSAMIIVGIVVWGWCWRRVQQMAALGGEIGLLERSSLTRRIYLFGFLFVASLTILIALMYILFRLISIALGQTFAGDLVADLAQAIAYSLIAGGVLATHSLALRTDNRLREAAERARQAQKRAVIFAEEALAQQIMTALQQQFPELKLAIARQEPGTDDAQQLATADMIVGAWRPSDDLSQLTRSPAYKLLVPLADQNWMWIGVEPATETDISRQLVQAVRQFLAGEPLRPQRGLSAGVVLGGVIAVLLIILLLSGTLIFLFSLFVF
ncbi:MAG: hypothetical protein J7465_14420 [Chloroflexus sp.]|nr:hypothetical protein [Chloroflexus sp.]